MPNCIACNQVTNNPKFCSRTCAIRTNNKLSPKRKLEGTCSKCGKPISKSLMSCRDCNPKLDWSSITLGECRKRHLYQLNNRVRDHARRTYLKSDKPKYCKVCNYIRHFEICHIHSISSYIDDTPISTINSLDNLVALCPNHHWEFDNGLLEL